MIKFEPANFRGKLASAIKTWDDAIDWDLPDGLVRPEEWDTEAEESQVITADTILDVSLPSWEESTELTCEEFVEIMAELETASLIEQQVCRTCKRALARVEPIGEKSFLFLQHAIPDAESPTEIPLRNEIIAQHKRVAEFNLKDSRPIEDYWKEKHKLSELEKRAGKTVSRYCINQFDYEGHQIRVSLTKGFTVFSLMVVKYGLYEDWFPPVTDAEAFIEVQSDNKLSDEVCNNIIDGYLFELSDSLGVDFAVAPRPELTDYTEMESDDFVHEFRIRPLMLGKGMAELLRLNARAFATTDPEFQILSYTKVVEYVAQTVIRQQSTEAIRSKLLSARALRPNVEFISELENIIETQRILKKDREAIRQTILTCCDVTELARFAPDCLPELRQVTGDSEAKLQREALTRFADTLY